MRRNKQTPCNQLRIKPIIGAGILSSYAAEIFALKAATKELAKQYFNDHQVLWRDLVEQLDNWILLLNRISDRWMDAFYLGHSKRRQTKNQHQGDLEDGRLNFNFDLEEIEKSVDASELVKCFVGLAYAETLSFMGDRPAAIRLVDSLLCTQRDRRKRLTEQSADL